MEDQDVFDAQKSQPHVKEHQNWKQGKQNPNQNGNKGIIDSNKIDLKLEVMLQDPECEEIKQQSIAFDIQDVNPDNTTKKSELNFFPKDFKTHDEDDQNKVRLSTCCNVSEACNIL